MIVCVAGMHRSGTSLVAHLLNSCGVYLGEPEDFAPPSFDNPEGYWENLHFTKINDRILADFGGAWDCPPRLFPGWEVSPSLDAIQNEASRLVQTFAGHGWWGWKDPRNSLTLPFWKAMLPEIRVVICLRNPLEVARSLQQRGFTSLQFGLSLWGVYCRQLSNTMDPLKHIITHYDSYFHDPVQELHRVITFLGLGTSQDLIETACVSADIRLRHHSYSEEDLEKSGLSQQATRLYKHLCKQSGPVFSSAAQVRSEQILQDNRNGVSVTFPGVNADGDALVHPLERALVGRSRELKAVREVLRDRETELESVKNILRAREEELSSVKTVLQAKEEELVSIKKTLKIRK